MKAVTQKAPVRRWLALLLAVVCNGLTHAADHVPPPPQRVPLLITNAVLHTVSGPVITGSVQPERRADLRAEVAAVVQQVSPGVAAAG